MAGVGGRCWLGGISALLAPPRALAGGLISGDSSAGETVRAAAPPARALCQPQPCARCDEAAGDGSGPSAASRHAGLWRGLGQGQGQAQHTPAGPPQPEGPGKSITVSGWERAWCPPGSFPLGGPLQGALCPTVGGLRWEAASVGSLLRGGGCGAEEVTDPGAGGCRTLREAALVGAMGQTGGQAACEPALCRPLGIRLQSWHASRGRVTPGHGMRQDCIATALQCHQYPTTPGSPRLLHWGAEANLGVASITPPN